MFAVHPWCPKLHRASTLAAAYCLLAVIIQDPWYLLWVAAGTALSLPTLHFLHKNQRRRHPKHVPEHAYQSLDKIPDHLPHAPKDPYDGPDPDDAPPAYCTQPRTAWIRCAVAWDITLTLLATLFGTLLILNTLTGTGANDLGDAPVFSPWNLASIGFGIATATIGIYAHYAASRPRH